MPSGVNFKMPKISVVVCTYNRCEGLKDTLRALKTQRLENGSDFEIIVVDNNSNDRTKETVMEEGRQSPRLIRYVFEPNQGVSFARNRGILEAMGDVIAFVDDDTVPASNWIGSLLRGFKEFNADCVGGPVFPIWAQEPPAWLRDPSLQFGMLALLDRGDQPVIAAETDSNIVFGGNSAYRKAIFAELGLFRTDLGRSGNTLSCGEDSEMIRRIVHSGKRAVYLPDMISNHKVGPERMSIKYLRKWHFDGGKSTARISKFRSGIMLELVSDCAKSAVAALMHYVCLKQPRAVGAEVNFWWKLGMLTQLWRGTNHGKS